MTTLQIILTILVVWFLISIPVSLFIAWLLSLKKESEADSLPMNKRNDYPIFRRLDETSH